MVWQMTLKHKVRINVGIVSSNRSEDLQPERYRILATESNEMLSSLIYGASSIEETIQKIVEKHIKIHYEWLDVKLVGVRRYAIEEDNSHEVSIDYVVHVPYQIEKLNGKWITLKELIDKEEKIDEHFYEILSHSNSF